MTILVRHEFQMSGLVWSFAHIVSVCKLSQVLGRKNVVVLGLINLIAISAITMQIPNPSTQIKHSFAPHSSHYIMLYKAPHNADCCVEARDPAQTVA